jgi:hypothetical protein
MKPITNTQLRIRLSPNATQRYAALPPVARMRVVSLILNAAAMKVDLNDLLSLRRPLVNTGNLLNQSLRLSKGPTANSEATSTVVAALKGLVG